MYFSAFLRHCTSLCIFGQALACRRPSMHLSPSHGWSPLISLQRSVGRTNQANQCPIVMQTKHILRDLVSLGHSQTVSVRLGVLESHQKRHPKSSQIPTYLDLKFEDNARSCHMPLKFDQFDHGPGRTAGFVSRSPTRHCLEPWNASKPDFVG